ncbi:MAG: hypothetical protein SFY80_06230 [Verrucomicrobiota bacterium]|nr:hypothetical protein [Verrucomicrobiota bacterium]
MKEKSDTEAPSPDWKLKLRYGKTKTPYVHFTALAEGTMKKKENDYGCPIGPAWMGMKTWATDSAESADMIRVIGAKLGFEIPGNVQIYDTEPTRPPRENPFGYDITFTPFTKHKAEHEGAGNTPAS